MLFVYNFGIALFRFILWFYAPFNLKVRIWLKGQNEVFSIQQIEPENKSVWCHFPSLGEFEQGRPVLEAIKLRFPEKRVVITFFSPSGYNVHKNYPLADGVFYLPFDTRTHAQKLIKLINPEIAIFTKYDFWYHYFNELKHNQIPLFVISAFFWENQSFFRWYGSLQRRMLRMVTHIFVQDANSKRLLNTIGIQHVTVSGDTRFDRVAKNASSVKTFPAVQAFCDDAKTFIAGSTWPPDEQLIDNLSKEYPDWKFIIAPHDISAARIQEIEGRFEGSVKYSEIEKHPEKQRARVLIIDNIGLLSSLYQYSKIAYIGGGFGRGIHNTLEAAAFKQPVIFVPNFSKFHEARALIDLGAAYTIQDAAELSAVMQKLQDEDLRINAGNIAGQYVADQTGATGIIIDHVYGSQIFESSAS